MNTKNENDGLLDLEVDGAGDIVESKKYTSSWDELVWELEVERRKINNIL